MACLLRDSAASKTGRQLQQKPLQHRLKLNLPFARRAGKFHERLYHYLSEGKLELPALRERPGDILSLAEYFLGIYTQRLNLPVPFISDGAQRVLERYSWPGNTRELENVIHFALLVSTGDEIQPEHLNLPDALSQIELFIKGATGQELAAIKQLLPQALS